MKKIIIPLVTTSLFSLPAQAQNEVKKPNIIVIFCDDMGYGDLGCYGSKLNRTPNLDNLANNGVRFTDCYAAASVSSPSRVALLTGRYPIRSGIVSVLYPYSTVGLDKSEMILPELLKGAGYYSGMIGKWHLGHLTEFLPMQHGFNEYFGIPYSNDMKPCSYLRGNEVDSVEINQNYITQTYTKETLRFITENKNRPFFLYLAHNMPHIPIHASPNFKGKSNNGLYGDVIEELDWSVGEIIKKLRELKLEENTLIVFSSDNGPWLRQGPNAGTSKPLFQGKFTSWDGGQREPTIAYWKGKIKPQVYTGMATLMDWFPTFAHLTGAKLPKNRIIDGQDISNILLINGKRTNEDFYYFENAKIFGYRSGDYKLILPHVILKGNKYVPDVPAHDTLLFNIRTDLNESNDLSKSKPDIVKEMSRKLNLFKKSIKDLQPKVDAKKPLSKGSD